MPRELVNLRKLLAGLTIPAVAVADTAIATVPDGGGSDAVSKPPSHGVEDIVVTANRRPQRLSDVAASVDTVDGSSLAVRGINSSADLQKLVPGFAAADTGVNVPAYSIRGIGLHDPSLTANAAVVVSLDEVPLPYAAMTQGALLDLERVEILKGPQGTLYGQNATGGAINQIAVKPTERPSAGGRIGFARFQTATAEAYVSGPVAPGLNARAAFNGTLGGPWQKSFTRRDRLGQVARAAGRILLNWKPDSAVEIDLALNHWIDRSDTQATQLVAFRPQTPANIPLLPEIFSAPLTPQAARSADWNPALDYARDDNFGQLSLKARYSLDDDLDLVSITSFSRYRGRAVNDRDGMRPTNFEFTAIGRINSFHQELRLAGDSPAAVWSIGANYRSDDTLDFQRTDVSGVTNTFIAGRKLNAAHIYSAQDVETYALFGDAELRLDRRWSIVAGARYTSDRRKFEGSTCDTGAGEVSDIYTFLANSFRAREGLAPLGPIAPGACVTLSVEDFTPGVVTDGLSETNVAFRTEVKFKPAERTLLYAGFSRGFKAGSFTTVSAVFALGYGPATQERVDAFEAGFAAPLFDSDVRLKGAVFHYDYRDKQFRGRILDPVIGHLPKLINIPRSAITGFEIGATARPMSGLSLYAEAAYLKTEVKSFTGVNLSGQVEDFRGESLPYAPPWSLNVGGEYAWRASSRLRAFAAADLAYRSSHSGFLGRDPPLDIRGYATLDLRAGVAGANGAWNLTLWGTNVTNRYYWHTAMRNGDTINRYAARPASYGMSLSVSY